MSFGANVKVELAHLWPEKACCLQAELAGVLTMGGHPGEKDGRPCLTVGTSQAAVARLVYRLLKTTGIKPFLRAANHSYRLEAVFSPESWRWLSAWPGLLNHQRRYSLRRLRRSGLGGNCCRRAFLRGAFLAAGSVSDPRRDYHLEIILPAAAWGANLIELLAPFGLTPRLGFRRGSPFLYCKEGGQIAQFLNVMGAHSALLDFESARVYKEVRSKVNRLVNCDTANLNRTVEASMRQMARIMYLRDHGYLAVLPPGLRDVAELRLNYPDACLRELGQMLTPVIGKAAVNYRLRRLEELATNLIAKGPSLSP